MSRPQPVPPAVPEGIDDQVFMDEKERQLVEIPERIGKILERYSKQYQSLNRVGSLWATKAATARNGEAPEDGLENKGFAETVQSAAFDATHLQQVVDEIELIEESLKTLIAARTKKTVTERVPVEKTRPRQYGLLLKLLVKLGVWRQRMETYTDYDLVKKEVPREPKEVEISEFRSMIDRYIDGLHNLNNGLHETVRQVDAIVGNLTDVSDAYTDEIHRERKAYVSQITRSRELEAQLSEVAQLHEKLDPLNDRYPDVEKARDHLEMALRDSQSMEFKYKTSIDMSNTYQSALKSYRKLINDFKERGDIHVSLVEKFAQGAGHMKIAVENVSQICQGVAKVTQSMIMIVESIEGGNKVLGRYAALIGQGVAQAPQWEMKYEELKEAENIFYQNDLARMEQLNSNRREIEELITDRPALDYEEE